MLRALALASTKPTSFFRSFPATFRTPIATQYGSFHSAAASRQEQNLGGSRQPVDNPSNRQDAAAEHSDSESSTAKLTRKTSFHDAQTSQASIPSSSEFGSSSPAHDNEHQAPPNLDAIKQRFREWSEQTAVVIRTRADDFTVRSKTTFSQLGAHLNKVTGYEEIEALKKQVVEQEHGLSAARRAAREAKRVYQQAVVQRSNSQREVNELLQRKSLWTDSDVGRFTTLVRQDHVYEQEEQRAKLAVDETEDAVEREFSNLMRIILARYHEEQVWSDKIRSASTYGSLAALGLNLLVFILAIVVVEPWKRRKLSKTFEKKIQELSMENAAKLDTSMQVIGSQLAQQEQLLEAMQEELRAKLEKLDSLERINLTTPEAVSEEDAPKLSLNGRVLDTVAGIGAGACVATLLSWYLSSR